MIYKYTKKLLFNFMKIKKKHVQAVWSYHITYYMNEYTKYNLHSC
jgi:hypothetical protein